MKRVPLRDRGQFRAREVLTAMLEQPLPGAGLTYADMRKRSRLLDAIEASKGSYVDFEEADYEILKGILEAFPFATAKRELRQILDDIANAKAPEDTLQMVKDAS